MSSGIDQKGMSAILLKVVRAAFGELALGTRFKSGRKQYHLYMTSVFTLQTCATCVHSSLSRQPDWPNSDLQDLQDMYPGLQCPTIKHAFQYLEGIFSLRRESKMPNIPCIVPLPSPKGSLLPKQDEACTVSECLHDVGPRTMPGRMQVHMQNLIPSLSLRLGPRI